MYFFFLKPPDKSTSELKRLQVSNSSSRNGMSLHNVELAFLIKTCGCRSPHYITTSYIERVSFFLFPFNDNNKEKIHKCHEKFVIVNLMQSLSNRKSSHETLNPRCVVCCLCLILASFFLFLFAR